MKIQWIKRTIAVAMTLSLFACKEGEDTGGYIPPPNIPAGAETGNIPDSGQTSCYYDIFIDGFYNPTENTCVGETAGWQPYGQDGHFTINAMSYTDNGNGTVLDNITGLTWQKCALGKSGTDCSAGSIGSYTWSGANTLCANSTLDGGGWRLPTVSELMRIADYGKTFITIDEAVFTGAGSSPYWTSTAHATYTIWAWYVNFSQGSIMADNKTAYHYARCVRG